MSIPTFVALYKSMVRSHLDYCCPVWSPYRKGDIEALEKVQKRATKLIPVLKDLPYKDRLKACIMSTLHYRRLRGDMIKTYKILSGKYEYDTNLVPNLKTTGIQATWGNDLRIFKTRFKYDLHKFHFTSHSQNPRIMRWSLAMQPYRYTVKYIRGSENVAADYLSRSN